MKHVPNVTIREAESFTDIVLNYSDSSVTLHLNKHWLDFDEGDVRTIVAFGRNNGFPFKESIISVVVDEWLPLGPLCGIEFRWSWWESFISHFTSRRERRLVFYLETVGI